MPIYALTPELIFPPADHAEPNGLLAVGGDLRPERLLLAYAEGIFPWFSDDQPILWHSPDPRMVLWGPDLHVPRSLRKTIRKEPFQLTLDTAFAEVVHQCAVVPRPDQTGTWITDDMADAYIVLHEHGFAHSVEAWCDGELVGGLYGVSLGGAFFGESMFTAATNASKIAFVALVKQLEAWGIGLIDCQVHTPHLERFGAECWPREQFLRALKEALKAPTHRGTWSFDTD